MVLIGAIIFSTFTNMVWQGVVLGNIFAKVRPRENQFRKKWKSNGPDRGNHFFNFYQHGLARDCLGNHFRKSEAMDEPDQEYVEQ